MVTRAIHILGVGGTLRSDSMSLRAIEFALGSSQSSGATVESILMHSLGLHMFIPGVPEEDLADPARQYLQVVRRADALIVSSGAYHGTLAGVTKNALDYLDYLSKDHSPYLQDCVVGLIATAGGDMAGVRALDAMIHVVHALRGVVVPLQVVIPQAWKMVGDEAVFGSSKWARRLDQLGRLVVEMAIKHSPKAGQEF